MIAAADGQVHTGIVKEDTPDHIRLIMPDGKFVSVPKADIEDSEAGRVRHAAGPDQASLRVRCPRPGRVPGDAEVIEPSSVSKHSPT